MLTEPGSAEIAGTNQSWDVVVVGAGPAGSMAAIQLAEPGLRLLLVDREEFPRHKVCGCCLNGVAMAKLEEAGLSSLAQSSGARHLREFHLLSRKKTSVLPMENSYSLSRKALDLSLTKAAVANGATFLSATHAQLERMEGNEWHLKLRNRSGEQTIRSRLILCADGLAGNFLATRKELAPVVSPRARIGVSTILSTPPKEIQDGLLYMAVGRHGYAGLVRLEDGALNIAAALDPTFLRQTRSPSSAIEGIFSEAGLCPLPELKNAQWKGTPPLTRRRTRLGAERLLILGDAAGYVEPFTGEGIAWALTSGQLVVEIARTALEGWHPNLIEAWEQTYHQFLGRRQRVCRLLSQILRHRPIYGSLNHLLRWNPGWGLRVMHGINRVD